MLAPIYIALGSNLGKRHGELHAAFEFLRSLNQGLPPIASAIYESSAVGPSSKAYLNAVCKLVHCPLMPYDLLAKIKTYEQERGRDLSAEKWSERLIDVDILYMGELVVQSQELSIPHKLLEERNFVLVPLLSLGDSQYGYVKKESLQRKLASLPFNSLQRTHLTWPTE